LNFIKETVDRLRVLLLRIERIIGLGHLVEPLLLKPVQTVIEEVQIENVVPQNLAVQKPLDDLEQIGRFTAAANPDAYRCLARNSFQRQASRHARFHRHLLRIQYHGLEGFQHVLLLATTASTYA